MDVLAWLSAKGGAGKTTLAVHTAVDSARDGIKTRLIDLDPQGSATLWGRQRQALAGSRRSAQVDVSAEHPANLDEAIEQARAAGYGRVILDTAPHADTISLKAARLAGRVLVPCRPAMFDLGALHDTLHICRMAGRDPVVVINAAPSRGRTGAEAEAEAVRLGAQVGRPHIHARVAFQHAVIEGLTAAEFEPSGQAAEEFGKFYRDICALIEA